MLPTAAVPRESAQQQNKPFEPFRVPRGSEDSRVGVLFFPRWVRDSPRPFLKAAVRRSEGWAWMVRFSRVPRAWDNKATVGARRRGYLGGGQFARRLVFGGHCLGNPNADPCLERLKVLPRASALSPPQRSAVFAQQITNSSDKTAKRASENGQKGAEHWAHRFWTGNNAYRSHSADALGWPQSPYFSSGSNKSALRWF